MDFRYPRLASLALCLMLCSTQASSEEIYKRVDAEGNVYYSDTPQNGAEKIDIKPITIVPAVKVLPATQENAKPDSAAAADKIIVKIDSPADGSAFHDAEGKVNVSIKVSPGLGNHQLLIKVDGKEVSKGQSTTTLLQNLDRGTHQLSGEVVDSSGKVISADSASFTIHKPVAKKVAPH